MSKVYVIGIFSTFLLLLSACNFSELDDVFDKKGSHAVQGGNKTLDPFESLIISGGVQAFIQKGEKQSIKIKGNKDHITNLKMSVENGVATFLLENTMYDHDELTLYITLPNIKEVSVNGSGLIRIEGFEKLKYLVAEINGSGDIVLDETSSVKGKLTVAINGSGDFSGLNAKVQYAEVDISGSGEVSVFPKEHLRIEINGSGDVKYMGNPKVETDINGSGDVIKVK
jgi:hypothetical protein